MSIISQRNCLLSNIEHSVDKSLMTCSAAAALCIKESQDLQIGKHQGHNLCFQIAGLGMALLDPLIIQSSESVPAIAGRLQYC